MRVRAASSTDRAVAVRSTTTGPMSPAEDLRAQLGQRLAYVLDPLLARRVGEVLLGDRGEYVVHGRQPAQQERCGSPAPSGSCGGGGRSGTSGGFELMGGAGYPQRRAVHGGSTAFPQHLPEDVRRTSKRPFTVVGRC